MKRYLGSIFLVMLLLSSIVSAQERAGEIIEINGNWHPSEVSKLEKICLYPEDYEGKSIRLKGFLFKPEDFEYFPEHDGYLFCCEPAVFGRNLNVHAYIGNATFLSREKLNFFCTKADGQLVRKLFKERASDLPVSADFVLQVQRRNGAYFGVVANFTYKVARD